MWCLVWLEPDSKGYHGILARLVRRKSVKIQEILTWSISALFIPGYLAWVLCSFSHKHDTSYNFLCHAVCKHSVFT